MKNNLEHKIKTLQNDFDIEVPDIGHLDRFQAKMDAQITPKKTHKKYFKFIAIAASFILLFGVVFNANSNEKGLELANVSPKMEQTQDYFSQAILRELDNINQLKNNKNEAIINDALKHLELLEKNYKKQTIELKNNYNNKVIIFAMIANFQQRITVLENLLIELENFEQLNIKTNENTSI